MVPNISIVTATINTPKWAELLIKSIRKFTVIDHEIIVIDNGSSPENLAWLRKQKDIRLIENKQNNFHGGAMDQGTELAKGRYICHMDNDSHFQRLGWDEDMIALYHKDPLTRLVCKNGPIHIGRPVHPPIFFYEKDFILSNGLSFKYIRGDPKAIDTAQKVYWDILNLGYKVELFSRGAFFYPGTGGNQIWINDRPTIYHHYNGSRFQEDRSPDDPLPPRTNNRGAWGGWIGDEEERKEHLARTAILFNQPLVMEILKG
jgi:glycosyltransferase involved in cell wall biosynthesis